jgi:hypothetical protein
MMAAAMHLFDRQEFATLLILRNMFLESNLRTILRLMLAGRGHAMLLAQGRRGKGSPHARGFSQAGSRWLGQLGQERGKEFRHGVPVSLGTTL